jgi:hypothetical protein
MTATHAKTESHASAISLPGRKFTPYHASIDAVRPEHSGPLGAVLLGCDAPVLDRTRQIRASRVVSRVGIAVSDQFFESSSPGLKNASIPNSFHLFVKPRWEGVSKVFRATPKVLEHVSPADEVERVTRDDRRLARIEAFLAGVEYRVTRVGNDPPHALPISCGPDPRVPKFSILGAGGSC